MSWDEADWAYTRYTGEPERLKKLFDNKPRFHYYDIKESEVTIHERWKGLWPLSEEELDELENVAIIYGIRIEYQYLDYNKHCFDHRNKEPNIIKILSRDLNYYNGLLQEILKKLSNEKFVSKAPANVIEMERKKQADAESKIASLKESIAALKK